MWLLVPAADACFWPQQSHVVHSSEAEVCAPAHFFLCVRGELGNVLSGALWAFVGWIIYYISRCYNIVSNK